MRSRKTPYAASLRRRRQPSRFATSRFAMWMRQNKRIRHLLDDAGGSRVEDVSFEVRASSCTVLCGRSGDGKSTVLRLADGLAGTFFPGVRMGSVLVSGTEVLSLSRSREDRGHGRGHAGSPQPVLHGDGRRRDRLLGRKTSGSTLLWPLSHVHEAARLCGVEGLLAEKLYRTVQRSETTRRNRSRYRVSPGRFSRSTSRPPTWTQEVLMP